MPTFQLQFSKKSIPVVDLKESRFTIGRDSSNDIVLDEPGISGFHAELHIDQGVVWLVDLGSSNGTYVNDKVVSGRLQLKAWDRLRFSDVTAELVDPNRRRPTQVQKAINLDQHTANKAPQSTQKPGWCLKGISQEVAGQTVELDRSKSVGRESADIVIPNPLVSRRHARIELVSGVPRVIDEGSANGTFVNGARVTEVTLKAGDEIRFDTTSFRVEQEGVDVNKTSVRKAVDADPNKTSVRPAVGETKTKVSVAASVARLVTKSGKPLNLTKEQVKIGRNPDNDIVLDDSSVSGYHATLRNTNQGWQLNDLDSTNGTRVNGKRITSALLKTDKTLLLGEVELKFQLSGTHAGPAAGLPGSETRAMPSIKTKAKTLPAWAWGASGFAVVLLFFVGFLTFRAMTPAPQIDAPLQASRVWSHTLPAAGSMQRHILSTPVLTDINNDGFLGVVLSDALGHVIAFDGEEGKRIFETPASERVVAALGTADLTGDGRADIIVGTMNGKVQAINGRGQVLWTSPANIDLGAITNRPVFYDVNNDGIPDVIIPTEKQGLVALDGARGWQIWNTAELSRGAVLGSPVKGDFNNDGITDFAFITDRGSLVAVSAQNDRVWKIWETNDLGRMSYASPALLSNRREHLIVVAGQGGVAAIRADNGRIAWTQRDLQGQEFIASPIGVNVTGRGLPEIALVSNQGRVSLLDGMTGDEHWHFDLGRQVAATPAPFDFTGNGHHDLLILDQRGAIHIVDSYRGRVILSRDNVLPAGDNIASPVLGDLTNDGLLEAALVGANGNIVVLGFNRRVARRGSSPWPIFLGNDQHVAP